MGDDDDNFDFPTKGIHSLAVLANLLICVACSYGLHTWKIYRFPESLAHILVGFLSGIIAIAFGQVDSDYLYVKDKLFVYIFLPPIALQAGYNLRRKMIMRNFLTTVVVTTLSVFINTMLIGFGSHLLAVNTDLGIAEFSVLQAFLFGTIFSAIDPIPILSVVSSKEYNVEPRLKHVLFVESLADIIAITLFHALTSFENEGPNSGDASSVLEGIGIFLGTAVGGIGIGIVVGLFCSLIYKRIRLDEYPSIEFLGVFIFAYAAYVLAEIGSLRGILSVFFCGVILQHYNWYNLSEAGRHVTEYGIGGIAIASETAIFLYLGVQLAFSFTNDSDLFWSASLIGWTFVIIILARGIYVIITSNIVNLIQSRSPITFRMQIFLWIAGLRGATCFALALNFPHINRNNIIPVAMAVIVLSILVVGLGTPSFISILDLRRGPDAPPFMQDSLIRRDRKISKQSNRSDIQGGQEFELEMEEGVTGSGFHLFWKSIDERYFKPLFGGPMEDRAYIVESYGGHDIQRI